jgi:hypothetical protein
MRRTPAGEEAEEADARLVGPLHVVDGDEQRAVRGEARAQPVEPVQARVRGLLAGALEERAGEARGAGEPALAIARPGCVEGGLEELADDPEGERALEL